MAFCTNCGTNVPDGIKFCTSCGTPMSVQAQPQAPPPPQQTYVQPQPAPQPLPQQAYTPPSQPAYAQPQPGYGAPAGDPNAPLPPGSKYEPITTGGYIGIFLLMLLPLINLILLIIWACGGCQKVNKANFARAMLIMMIIGSVLSLLMFFAVRMLFGSEIDSLMEAFGTDYVRYLYIYIFGRFRRSTQIITILKLEGNKLWHSVENVDNK